MKKLITVMIFAASPAVAEEVAEVGVDWVGNDIVIEAIHDPKVEGVTCHLAYFSRSVIDRLSQGNWFEDPSNSAIECSQTGPIRIGDVSDSEDGEEVLHDELASDIGITVGSPATRGRCRATRILGTSAR